MRTLTDIANSYELDKGTLPPSQCSWHAKYPDHHTLGYTKVYERYMEPRKNSATAIMEIGVSDLRFPLKSMIMWEEYFQNATIHGIDNFWGKPSHSRMKDWIYAQAGTYSNGVRSDVTICDQSSRCDMQWFFERFTKEFDFIVEDGAHWPSHIMISLACCFPHVKSGGVYFIEDLQNPAFAGHASYDNVQITQSLTEFQRTGELRRLYITREEHAMLLDSIACIDLVACGPSILAAITKK